MKKQLLKNNILSFSFLVFLLGAFNVLQAQAYTWVGGVSSDFMTAANWSSTPVFNNAETFTVGAGSPNNAVLGSAGYTLTSSSPTIAGLALPNSGNLTISGNINVNSVSYWNGVLTVNGGLLNVRNSFYFGDSAVITGIVPTANVETGGSLNVKTFLIIGQKQPAALNVNGGTVTTDGTGSILIGNYPSYPASSGTINLNSGIVHARANGFTIGTKGTGNINGGLLDIIAGNTSVGNILNINGGDVNFLAGTSTINTSGVNTSGVININGGKMDVAGPLTIGAGTVNLNGGLINFSAAGALTLSGTSSINIDGGNLVLMGDQVTALATYISSAAIKLSAAAVTAGKTLTNTFDSVTGLTTVKAVAPLATESFEKSDVVKAYPNPTTDSVTVSLPNGATVQKIAVYNSLGQLVRTETKNSVSLQHLANGNYYLTIYTAEGNYSKKIIKQ